MLKDSPIQTCVLVTETRDNNIYKYSMFIFSPTKYVAVSFEIILLSHNMQNTAKELIVQGPGCKFSA
jgi:hypothetical protein